MVYFDNTLPCDKLDLFICRRPGSLVVERSPDAQSISVSHSGFSCVVCLFVFCFVFLN